MAFTQERIDGIPVLAGHTRRAGHPLDDGLVVPTGTVLLGEPLAIAHPLSNVRRWTAAFVLIGSISAAVTDLRGQLRSSGHRVSSACIPSGSDGTSCRLSAVRDEPIGQRRLTWAEIGRAPATAGGSPSSYLHLEVMAERREAVATRDWGSLITDDEGPIEEVRLPVGWPDLPTAGEAIFPAAGGPGRAEVRQLRVPDGTSPIGPAVGPRVVLIQPRGRVARSFDDLVSQARVAIGTRAMVTRAPDARQDGVRVRFATIGERGERGGEPALHIRAVEQRDHPSYLVLELAIDTR